MDSSTKFGVICLKIKARRDFFLLLLLLSIFCFLVMSLLNDVTMQLLL